MARLTFACVILVVGGAVAKVCRLRVVAAYWPVGAVEVPIQCRGGVFIDGAGDNHVAVFAEAFWIGQSQSPTGVSLVAVRMFNDALSCEGAGSWETNTFVCIGPLEVWIVASWVV